MGGPLLASGPWGCLERARPAGRKGVPLATEAGRQLDLPYHLPPDARVLPLPAQLPGAQRGI